MSNKVTWFQVGSNEPEQAKAFYGELFGWKFLADPNSGGDYDLIQYADGDHPVGGVAHTEEAADNHATFYVEVADLSATIAAAERLGAKVLVPPVKDKSGLAFAHLVDTSGNRFAVFTPRPA